MEAVAQEASQLQAGNQPAAAIQVVIPANREVRYQEEAGEERRLPLGKVRAQQRLNVPPNSKSAAVVLILASVQMGICVTVLIRPNVEVLAEVSAQQLLLQVVEAVLAQAQELELVLAAAQVKEPEGVPHRIVVVTVELVIVRVKEPEEALRQAVAVQGFLLPGTAKLVPKQAVKGRMFVGQIILAVAPLERNWMSMEIVPQTLQELTEQSVRRRKYKAVMKEENCVR